MFLTKSLADLHSANQAYGNDYCLRLRIQSNLIQLNRIFIPPPVKEDSKPVRSFDLDATVMYVDNLEVSREVSDSGESWVSLSGEDAQAVLTADVRLEFHRWTLQPSLSAAF